MHCEVSAPAGEVLREEKLGVRREAHVGWRLNVGQRANLGYRRRYGGRGGFGEVQGVLASYEVAQSEIDDESREQEVGEYQVGYIVEPKEGWWRDAPENLAWREPVAGETNHIEILPFEAEPGLLVPRRRST